MKRQRRTSDLQGSRFPPQGYPRENRKRTQPNVESLEFQSVNGRLTPNVRGLASEIFGIAFGKRCPLFRKIVERKDGRHRTYRHARAAIDALHRIDVEHFFFSVSGCIFLRMNAIYRAGVHAGSVFCSDARFCNHIGHKFIVSLIRRLVCTATVGTGYSSKNAA
jgi:hypothetical protein